MKKRLLAVIVSATALTGCSTVLDVFGPQPNAGLVALMQQAEADASLLIDDPSVAELRSTQAGELRAEIERLCGHDEHGEVPGSCKVAPQEDGPDELAATRDSSTSDAVSKNVDLITDTWDTLPAESRDLIAAQAVDFVTTAPVEVSYTEITNAVDRTAAQTMLEREYALSYGLGLASAWADNALQARIDALNAAANERIAVLEAITGTTGGASGYEFQSGSTPQTTEDAVALVHDMSTRLVTEWRTTAAHAESSQWASLSVQLAGHAQRTHAAGTQLF